MNNLSKLNQEHQLLNKNQKTQKGFNSYNKFKGKKGQGIHIIGDALIESMKKNQKINN